MKCINSIDSPFYDLVLWFVLSGSLSKLYGHPQTGENEKLKHHSWCLSIRGGVHPGLSINQDTF